MNIEEAIAALTNRGSYVTIAPYEAASVLIQAYDSAKYVMESQRLEIESLRSDSERWRFVRDELAQPMSLHMDGTACWRLRSTGLARTRSFAETIDLLIEHGSKEAK